MHQQTGEVLKTVLHNVSLRVHYHIAEAAEHTETEMNAVGESREIMPADILYVSCKVSTTP